MRLILMRHGESYNNVLAMVSRDDYKYKRVAEPAACTQTHEPVARRRLR